MAKPIEIPLSAVWNRKSIVKLRMSQFGGYVNLVRAALFEDFNPFDCSDNSLREYAKSNNPQMWMKCRREIIEALHDTLPILRELYERELQIRAGYRVRGVKGSLVTKSKLVTKVEAKPKEDTFLSDSSTAPSIIQPIKAPKYRPQTTDIQARTEASRKILQPKVNRLTD